MKKLLIGLAFCWSTLVMAVEVEPFFSFSSIPVNQASNLIFGEALKVPYFLSPELVADARPVSFRSSAVGLSTYLVGFFDRLGYSYTNTAGLHVVQKKMDAIALQDEKLVHVYRPKYRSAQYLNEILRPAFGGSIANIAGLRNDASTQAVPGTKPATLGTAASLIDTSGDVVILKDSQKAIDKVLVVLTALDKPTDDLNVQGLVVEYTRSKGESSALEAAGTLFNGALSVNIGSVIQGANVAFKILPSLSLAASLLDSDSRFKLISKPNLRVRSGSQAVITVGQDVPVIGSVTVPTGGASLRSVEYKTTGTIFKITPTLRDSGRVDVDLVQSLSSAYATDTGVNDSPTVSRREISSAVTVKLGEYFSLGGLLENKSTGTGRSLFAFKIGGSSSDSETEYLVFLVVNLVT
jgi:type II secretory pathway component GspD/PulD (secretin)